MERVKLVNKKLKPLAIGFFFICLLVTMVFSFYSMPTVKADNTNLAPFPSGWVDDHTWNNVPYGAVQHETSITHGGAYTLKIVPSVSVNSFDAFDFWVVSAPVGSRVVISVWVKTLGSGYVWLNGAFLGLDYYSVGQKRIAGMNCLADAVSGVGWSPFHSGGGDVDAGMVHWGTDWTQITWDFVVPSLVEGDGLLSGQVPANQFVAPAYFCPWLEVVSSNYPSDAYTAYFSDMQIYVNPSGVSTPSPSPVPSASPTASPNPSASPTATPLPTPTLTPSPTPFVPSSQYFVITQSPFIMNYNTGGSFAVQSLNPVSKITFTVTSGTLNGTGSVNASNTGGIFQILPTTSGTLLVTTSGAQVAVYIDGVYHNNIPFDFFPGDPVITWTYGGTVIVSNNGVQYYFRSDTYHTLGVTGSGFDGDYTNTLQHSLNGIYSGVGDVTYGFQVYLFSSPTKYTELTSGPSATMLVNGNYSNSMSSIINIPQTAITLGYQALQINVLEQFNGGSWVTVANFISPVLITNSIEASTWQFTLQINQTQTGGNTYSNFLFGNNAYQSGVNNILFSKPLQSDVAMWRLSRGDYIGFLLGEYLDEIGIGFYGLCLFLVGSTLYFRYKSFGTILFFFSIYGGVGGIAWIFLPPWAAAVAAAIIIIGGSFLVWRIVR